VLALEFDDLAKIVQPKDGRFAAVPKEIDYCFRGDLNLLDNILLQQVVGHTKRPGLWIEQLLLQVVTIVAVQVTYCPYRFGKDLKFTRGLDCHSVLPYAGVSLMGMDVSPQQVSHRIEEML
jgi:hypothetical protein